MLTVVVVVTMMVVAAAVVGVFVGTFAGAFRQHAAVGLPERSTPLSMYFQNIVVRHARAEARTHTILYMCFAAVTLRVSLWTKHCHE
jgi:hypothetical protein